MNLVCPDGSVTLGIDHMRTSFTTGFEPISKQIDDSPFGSTTSPTSLSPATNGYIPYWVPMGAITGTPGVFITPPSNGGGSFGGEFYSNGQLVYPGESIVASGWSWGICAAVNDGSADPCMSFTGRYGTVPGRLGWGGWSADILKWNPSSSAPNRNNADYRRGCSLTGSLDTGFVLSLSSIPTWVYSVAGTNTYNIGVSVYFQKNGSILNTNTYFSSPFDIVAGPCLPPKQVSIQVNPYNQHVLLVWNGNNTVDIDYQSGFNTAQGPLWTNLQTAYVSGLSSWGGFFYYDLTANNHNLIAFPLVGQGFRIRGNCGGGLTSYYVYVSEPDIWWKLNGRRPQSFHR